MMEVDSVLTLAEKIVRAISEAKLSERLMVDNMEIVATGKHSAMVFVGMCDQAIGQYAHLHFLGEHSLRLKEVEKEMVSA